MAVLSPKERRYKFRAESEPDMFRYVAKVLEMHDRASAENVNRLADGSVTCELITTLALDHLRDRDRFGSDLRVILTTIKPVDEYSG
jgi:hypothetical protein